MKIVLYSQHPESTDDATGSEYVVIMEDTEDPEQFNEPGFYVDSISENLDIDTSFPTETPLRHLHGE